MMLIALGALLIYGTVTADNVHTASLFLIAGIACIYFGLGV